MKCPNCRAEIISNTVETCPYCGSSLAKPPEDRKQVERIENHESIEIAERIREAIELQKAIYKLEKTGKAEKVVTTETLEEAWREKKYSTSDIIVLFVSLTLTFIVLVLTFSLILGK